VLFLSPALLAYAGAMAIVCHAFVVAYEEPTLRRRFGVVYDNYLATIDRWIPNVQVAIGTLTQNKRRNTHTP
jgi:protein-S-isoprenylcysteine O-methyltransferase Ste14